MIIYNKTIWENNKTPLNNENLQKIEDGIEYLFDLNREVPQSENLRVLAETQRELREGKRQSDEIERNKKVDANIGIMNNVKTDLQNKVDTKIVEVDTKINSKVLEASNKITDVENRFLYLTANQQQDSEVLDARLAQDGTRHISLKARIDSIETQPYVLFEEVEG